MLWVLNGCYLSPEMGANGIYFKDNRVKSVEIKEDKFNNSVVITMNGLCRGKSETGYDKNTCSLVYYKDAKEDLYYINGNLVIDRGIRGRNLYKAVDLNSKDLQLVLEPDSRLGWYNDHYQIRLPRNYFGGDIEIKLYGKTTSSVIKIENKNIAKFLSEVDNYKTNGK